MPSAIINTLKLPNLVKWKNLDPLRGGHASEKRNPYDIGYRLSEELKTVVQVIRLSAFAQSTKAIPGQHHRLNSGPDNR